MSDHIEWTHASAAGFQWLPPNGVAPDHQTPEHGGGALILDALAIEGTPTEIIDLLDRAKTLLQAVESEEDVLAALREDCGYDPEGDTGVDSLIDYKDALEDRFYGAHEALRKLHADAEAFIEEYDRPGGWLFDDGSWTGTEAEAEAAAAEATRDAYAKALAILAGENPRPGEAS